jgi:hypothetical protein
MWRVRSLQEVVQRNIPSPKVGMTASFTLTEAEYRKLVLRFQQGVTRLFTIG